jgi:riboflavin kinase / FMN adenylyltransferase
MRVHHGVADLPAGLVSAVTIGKFDGVHLGHRAIVARLRELAAAQDAASVVVTFDRHPRALLDPAGAPQPLSSLDQKLDLLAAQGVDEAVVLAFDERLSALAPDAFVRDVLCGPLGARSVLVGRDFRYGARGAGDVALLRELGPTLGFETVVVDDVVPTGERRVSSQWIRELLGTGHPDRAAELLGRPHAMRGAVVRGKQRGRELGYPTANLAPDAEGLVPADGVYAGWLTHAGERMAAAISVGDNPTFDDVTRKVVEAHVLDRTLDLYDAVVEVEFVHYLRGMVAFTGVEALKAEMANDDAETRRLLGV